VHESLTEGGGARPFYRWRVRPTTAILSPNISKVRHWPRRKVRQWLLVRWADDLLRSRVAAHLAIILSALLVVVLGQAVGFRLPLQAEFSAPVSLRGQATQAPEDYAPAFIKSYYPALPAAPLVNEDSLVMPVAVPFTTIPDRPRQEITRYVVQPGDTIFGIAARFNLQPETIMWANGRFVEDNPDLLRIGQELIILPVDGVYHQVGRGETIAKIAGAFKVDPAAIINFPLNNLDPDNPQIKAGQWLVVPGGTKPYIPRQVVAYSGPIPESAQKGTGVFGWPAAGQISQGYWSRHRAIDIASWEGAPVVAADSGYVVAAGWDDSGYGRMVIIDHGNGFQTLYAHLRKFYVKVGQSIAKGEALGEVGTTGNASGPHLHFEVRQGGVQRNPFGFLP